MSTTSTIDSKVYLHQIVMRIIFRKSTFTYHHPSRKLNPNIEFHVTTTRQQYWTLQSLFRFFMATYWIVYYTKQYMYQLICVGCVRTPNSKKKYGSTKIRTHELSPNSTRCQPLYHNRLLYTNRKTQRISINIVRPVATNKKWHRRIVLWRFSRLASNHSEHA